MAATIVIAATVALMLYALTTGTLYFPLDRVLATLFGHGTKIEELVIIDRRLSRLSAAVLVGFALGFSGAITQSITRNPIASPDILGVTTGAGFFAVLVVANPGLRDLIDLPTNRAISLSALVGGLLTTALILALSWRAGFDGLRLILVGISVNALALAGIAFVLLRSELADAAVATRWLSGSLLAARMPEVYVLGPVVLAVVVCGLVLRKDLTALRLGRELAPVLGSHPARTEAAALLLAVVVVSVATAVAGPIAFVAFVAPQAAMRLFGTAGPPPIAGGLFGALLLLVADLATQRLPVELPVGVLTAVIGAPYLLYLMIHLMRRQSV
ncbi:hypothetical protein ASG90_20370 [Nocardioides sp. Soil797]|nr:hypothetical protein ASG90_20370 [Nocardioides sp. Soil797]